MAKLRPFPPEATLCADQGKHAPLETATLTLKRQLESRVAIRFIGIKAMTEAFTANLGAQESTISEISANYKLSLRTLRFYEDKGILSPRRVGSMRLYSERDRIRLKLVLTGKRLGFTLTEIATLIQLRVNNATLDKANFVEALSESEIRHRIAILEKRREELNAAIDELKHVGHRSCQSAACVEDAS